VNIYIYIIMNIKTWLHSETSKYIISVILGLGLSTLFRKECYKDNCIVFMSPPVNDLENNTYLYGDNCYKYKSKSMLCDNQKKSVRFA
jgi:hypothetical protein